MKFERKPCAVYKLITVLRPVAGEVFYVGSTYAPERRFEQHRNREVASTKERITSIWAAGGGIQMKVIKWLPSKALALECELGLLLKARQTGRALCNLETYCDQPFLTELIRTNYLLNSAGYKRLAAEFPGMMPRE